MPTQVSVVTQKVTHYKTEAFLPPFLLMHWKDIVNSFSQKGIIDEKFVFLQNKTDVMKQRIALLFKLYFLLLLLFVLQKAFFMLVNMGYADGAPFGECLLVFWHGLRLDSVAASYLLIVPLLLAVVSCFVKKMRLEKALFFYYVPIALVMALVFAADLVLYHFWGAKMDANDLIYALKPKDMLASVSWWTIPIGIVLIGALTWFYLFCFKRVTGKDFNPVANRWAGLLFIPLAGLVFLGMRGGVSQSTANPSYAYYSNHSFCNHSALNPLFNMFHSLSKKENLEEEFCFMPDSEAEGIVAPCFATSAEITDTLLSTARPDVLLVVWEGGGWDMTMNDSVAPNLMQFATEGILFTNCYANNFRTDRGLVSILNGWPGMPTTSLMKMSGLCGRLPSIVRTLHSEGYATRFVYGGDIDFTNMRGYMLETGFESVAGSEAFGRQAKLSSWGAPDAYTLLPTVLGYEAHSDKPRLDVILTLSSHEPWNVPIDRLDDSRKNSFAYTDSCLAVLIDSLKQMPVWDNLLVIIVPDHGVPLSSSQSTSDYKVSHIPMVWTGGAVKGHSKVIDAMMSQSDIAATLLSQIQLDSSPFPFSRNVLSPQYAGNYHFAVHCFKNGCNLIDSAGVTRFECADRSATVLSGTHGDNEATFIKAMLQYLYKTTAAVFKK